MKVLITTCALVFIFSMFTMFQHDNNSYIRYQEQLKFEAENCSDVAALYYDEEEFAEGITIFNKNEGNKAIKYIVQKNLELNDSFSSTSYYLKDKCEYTTYYFDGDGTITCYNGENLTSQTKNAVYPYEFTESVTGYKKTINKATVIVTIDAGKFDYRLSFINDPELIRTSGYEYWENQ